MTEDFRNILFLDIETVAATDSYDTLDERLKTQWARKASFFKTREEGQSDEDLFHERAGIYAEFGKIIVIAIGKFTDNEKGERCLKTRCLANHDEKALLNEFKTIVEKMDQSTLKLCAHNGKEFDFPYISRRMLVNEISLPAVLNTSGRKSWEIPHIDTMEMWKFGDYKHYTSLDLLAAIFNIPTSKGELDGSKVNSTYYQEKDLKKIAEYCVGDVVALAQLFLKLKGQSMVLPENNIQLKLPL
ncbi:MAG TPA: 3'-5' exonuclease [Cyclobacteriaceae bacterium]|nr:3'-5' exonuclease [Cyclobacteriaceae bacterium]